MTIHDYDEIFQYPVFKNMHLVFSEPNEEDIELTNEDICSEEMSLEESLSSSGDDLVFGSCEASCFKVRVVNNNSFKGKLLTVTMELQTEGDTGNLVDNNGNYIVDNEGNYLTFMIYDGGVKPQVPYGTFKVFSDQPSNDRMWRDLVCYDLMYDILNADVKTWYESLTFPMSVKDFRDSFFTNFSDVDQVTTTLTNDDFMIQGGFVAEGVLSGKTIINAICELNGVFGHINRDGDFEYISLPSTDTLTYGWYIDGTGKYEDYETDLITGIVARGEAEDVGTTVGTMTNPLIIENNPLIYGTEGTQELTTALQNLLSEIGTFSYRPFNVDTYGNPMLPIGTSVTLNIKRFDPDNGYSDFAINSFIMHRTLTGLQGLVDSISASGNKERESTVNNMQSELKRTKGRMHKLIVDVDQFYSELEDFEEETSTKFEQTSKEIRTEVNGVLVGSIADESWVTSSTLSTISDFWSDTTPSTPISHYNEIVCTEYVPIDLNFYASAEDNEGSYFLVHTGGTSAYLYQSVYNEATDDYSWVSQSMLISANSYDRNVLTVDLSNDASYADFVLEDKIGFSVDLTLGTDITNTTREVWLKLILPPKSGVINRTCYRPIYINGEKMTDEYTKSGDTITLIYTDYESITTDLVQPEGFKGVWAVTVDTRVQSSIDQLSNQIVLKVETATGKIVQVELGADASTGTEFKVSADNISFIANKKIELTSNQLEINSTYFKVSSAGAITCTSGEIGGWSIDSNRLYKTITSGSVSKTTYLKPGELKFYGTDIVDKPNSIFSNSGLKLYNDSTLTFALDGSARDGIVLITNYDLVARDYKRQSNWSGSSTTDLNTVIGSLTPIGAIVEGSSSGMSTAVAPSTPKSVMKLTLTKGVWVIDGNCEFPQHNTGRRVLLISSAENALNGDDESRIVIDSVQGSVTRPHTSTIRNVSLASQTFYLNAWQNSGSELAVTPHMRAVRIR